MNVTKTSIAIAFLMLAVPVGSSTWSASGNIEPSTNYDSPAWMFQDPPAPGQKKAYFNVFTQTAPLGVAGVSPNSATLGTQVESPTNEYHMAVLGVWVDCNGDGYIGLAESAMKEYPASLLLDTSVCPPTAGTPNSWVEGAHNYRGWVTELIPIGRTPPLGATADTRTYLNPNVAVWGDYGKPDERATFRSCALAPQPRGTYQSTGGALNYAECRFEQNGFDGLGTFNDAMGTIGDPLGLAGTDPHGDDWRTSGLDVQTFGSEDTQYSPASVWDCGSQTTLGEMAGPAGPVLATVAPEAAETRFAAVNPQLGNTANPTVPAFVNQTMEGMVFLDTDQANDHATDCDTSNDAGHDFYGNWLTFYVGEEDFNGVSPNNKKEADWNFNFSMETRGTIPFGPATATGSSGGPGTTAFLPYTGVAETAWYSPSVYASKLGPRTFKVDLESASAGFSRGWWLSFYAYVDPAFAAAKQIQLPGNSDVYGSWQCGLNTSGIHHGWNCDANTWYKNQDGSHYPEPFPFARPGITPYNLRDVDCYDGRIGDTGVGVLPAFYGDEPCP